MPLGGRSKINGKVATLHHQQDKIKISTQEIDSISKKIENEYKTMNITEFQTVYKWGVGEG